jgi:hypothetical protein
MEHAAGEGANNISDQPNADYGTTTTTTTTHEVEEVGEVGGGGGYHPPSVRRMNYFDADTILQFADAYCPFNFEGMHLNVANMDFTNTSWVETVGRAIGESEHLRRLELLDDEDEPANNCSLLFNLIATNRSMEHLAMECFDHGSLDIFDVLAPFFVDNHNLRGLEVIGSDISLRIPSLISALMLETMTNRLECIELTNCGIRHKQAEDLINALRSNSGSSKLLHLGLGGNVIGIEGCIALGNLLTDSSCKIHSLDISDNDLNDDCIGTLSSALDYHKNTIKVLNIGSQEGLVASSGFQSLANFLSSSNCMLEKLEIVLVDDMCALYLGISLVTNNTLKHIDFRSSNDFSYCLSFEISKCLRAPNSVLLQVNLSDCGIDDQGANALISALEVNATLKTLDLSENRTITSEGWVRCFMLLSPSSFSTLEEFSLNDNNIEDPAVLLLTSSMLGNMTKVRSLSLLRNDFISTKGWWFFAMLVAPSSKLRRLHIGTSDLTERSINDYIINLFAPGLAKNTTLEDLDFGCTNITQNGWFRLCESLCDCSSVDSICYNSNHTLKKLNISPRMDIPPYISNMIHLNACCKKTIDAARLKVNLYYFSDVDTVACVFGPMEVTILPYAIGWMGRDRFRGFTALFHLVQSTPALLEHVHNSSGQS